MISILGVFKDKKDNMIKTACNVAGLGNVEMSLTSNGDVDTIYVPTHYICTYGCVMCESTSLSNKDSNMRGIEYKDFLDCFYASLCKNGEKRSENKKLVVSFTGMGEPLGNQDLLVSVLLHLSKDLKWFKPLEEYDEIGFEITTVMPDVATQNLLNTIQKYHIPVKINYSMLSSVEQKKYDMLSVLISSIDSALIKLKDYEKMILTNPETLKNFRNMFKGKDPIEIFYIPMKGVNDSEQELRELCYMTQHNDIPVKLIKALSHGKILESPNLEDWAYELSKATSVEIYKPIGEDIGSPFGGCVAPFYKQDMSEEEVQEFEKWKFVHQIVEKQREGILSWDECFMAIAKVAALRSKDPNTQVGACIVSRDNRPLSFGYNGTPNGFDDEQFPWDRTGDALKNKYMFVVHAERNAILNYRGNMRDLVGATIYVDLFPCNECAKEIIQCGITEVVYLSDKYADSESTIASKMLFDKCGVTYRQLSKEHQKTITLDMKANE